VVGSEAVAGGDAHDIVRSDQQAEEWDFVFRMAAAVAAAVEHDEDGEACGRLCRPISNVGFEHDESRHVAVAHGNVLDRFSDLVGTACSQPLLEIRKTSGRGSFKVRDRP
jgi:hypothetical protein